MIIKQSLKVGQDNLKRNLNEIWPDKWDMEEKKKEKGERLDFKSI